MFVMKDERRFTWPIRVVEPNDKGANPAATFKGVFVAMPRDEYDAEVEKVFSGDDLVSNEEAAAFVEKFMRGWEEVVDEDKNAVPFTRETLVKALEYPPMLPAILAAYNEALTPAAKRDRRRKN